MKHKFHLVAMFVLLTSLAACSRAVGSDDEPEYVTRRQVIIDLVMMVTGQPLADGECISTYPDVEDNSQLCRALNILADRGLDNMGDFDGSFRPEDVVNHAESWAMINWILGFVKHDQPRCAPDVQDDEWWVLYFGTHCSKGLFVGSPEGLANPGNLTTLDEWETQVEVLRDYMSEYTTRADVVEMVFVILLNEFINYSNDCFATYDDVEDNTPLCYITEALIDEGLLDPDQQNFLPENEPIWDEILPLFFKTIGVPEGPYTGCSGVHPENHAARWFDTLCELNLYSGYMVDGERTVRFGTHMLIWNLAIYNNSL